MTCRSHDIIHWSHVCHVTLLTVLLTVIDQEYPMECGVVRV